MRGGTTKQTAIAILVVAFALIGALAVAAVAYADSGNEVTVESLEAGGSTDTTTTPGTTPETTEPTSPVETPTAPVRKPRKAPAKKKPAAKKPASRERKPAGGDDDTLSSDTGDSGADRADDPLGREASPDGPVSVPNFFLKQFQIPPFLLPIYQAAGTQYGIRWEILAAINEIETNYGRNLNISSAGALGWMQFMPATWAMYGVDANNDGVKDPFNPVDAIFAAARYLKAAGGMENLQKAIFAYNHAQWYVDQVLLRAKLIAGVPDGLVDSLTGLTQGHFPVYARSHYAGQVNSRRASKRVAHGTNAADVVEGDARRNGTKIFSKRGAPVVAVQDAVVKKIGFSSKDGYFIVIQDGYGNRYRYGHLGKLAKYYPVPRTKGDRRSRGEDEAALAAEIAEEQSKRGKRIGPRLAEKDRFYAHPARKRAQSNGSYEALAGSGIPMPGYETFDNYFSRPFGLKREDVILKPLKVGARVIGGTILGRMGRIGDDRAPYMHFQVRPAGRGAPVIDPKPILDGWKLLESTAIYRAMGVNPLVPQNTNGSADRSIGQILLMSKEQLEEYVLDRPSIDIYECGRDDIRAGQIDRRVLALIAYLDAEGLHPTVSSLTCGHGFYTASGNVSHHSTGTAVDIAAINGESMAASNGPGGLMERTVKKIMTLQGVLEPAQIISLFDLGGSTLAMGDHADHIHVGFRPGYGINARAARGLKGKQARSILRRSDWERVFDRLGEIENPAVPTRPSPYAIKVRKKHGVRPGHDD